jgi:rhodanese-related sulfurtransferase
MKTLSMDQLHEKLKNLGKDELILDVRTDEEYADGHVPGARNIPFDEVAPHVKELGRYRNVYLYCRSGSRVRFACQELGQLGLSNLAGVVSGGMPDWIAAGYPTEK